MALEAGVVHLEVRPDVDRFGRDLSSGIKSKMAGVARVAKTAALGIGVAMGAAVVGIKLAVDAASDLNESLSKVGVVFGKNGAEVVKWSKTSAIAMGISQQAALEAAGTFGNLFTAMKIGLNPATNMSKSLVKLASDLASFNNQDPEEVLINLRAGLVGEAEPLRKYGINISAAATMQEALNLKIAKTGDVLTPAQKAQANYSLIMKQSTTAQGDFARTADGVANRQRIVSAQFTNLKAKIGNVFLPIAQKLLTWASAAMAWFTKMGPTFKRWGRIALDIGRDIIASLIPAIRGIVDWFDRMWPTISKIASFVGTQLMEALRALWAALSKDIIPAIKEWWKASAPLRKVLIAVIGAILWLALKVLPIAIRIVGKMITAQIKMYTTISKVIGGVIRFGTAVGRAVMAAWGFVSKWGGKILSFFKEMPGKILGFLKSLPSKFGQLFSAVARAIVDWWNRIDIGFHLDLNLPGPLPDIHVGIADIVPDVHLAEGGIVRRRTLAMVGERGPEAVVPLSGGRGQMHVIVDNPHDFTNENENVRLDHRMARSER